jgi:hypothetical protein
MATWQHLRSSTANKRPTTSLADGRIAINTNTASPGLFFKDSAGTGIVKVGPVHVGTTAPNSVPASGGSSGNYTGEQWLDTSVSPAQMKVWNGSTWVGIVADELPVSKLQDGAARQLIQTDAAGTGVEWTSNVDVPGTLDVTSTATFDSIAQHPLGTAGAPTITFTGDTNTGIYSPGADQVAISTNGTGRLFVDSTGQVRLTNGNVFTASDNTGFLALYGGGAFNGGAGIILYGSANATEANVIRFVNGSFSERARIDSSGRLLVGTSTSVFGSTVQAVSTGGAQYEGARFSADAFGPAITLIKSRGASVGTNTAVQNDDVLGSIAFRGANGSDYSNVGAQIIAVVDGEPFTSGDTTDLPTRLVFFTCPDGASSPTERFRITNDGVIAHDQPAPAAVNATATLTIANLKAGIITSTSAAATDMTLPTGTDTQAGFSGTYDNFTFEWSVINTGPSLVRVLAGTAHTVVGSGSVATGTSGRFASRRTAANTFVTYRLS